MSGQHFLAHSAPNKDAEPQTYPDHIGGVRRRARENARAAAAFARDPGDFVEIVEFSAEFHDLGKLDPDNQTALRQGRGARLGWDHIDAGVAHLLSCGAKASAWLVRAHHSPGLPSRPEHKARSGLPALRGRRRDEQSPERHLEQIDRTNRLLPAMLADHATAIGKSAPRKQGELRGLSARLALSCLVDADHADTAEFDTGRAPPTAAPARWEERLAALDTYVAGLPDRGGERDRLRRQFYHACRYDGPDAALASCEGPVGIGKTTAVTAHLLRRAISTGARHLIVVAPFTNILTQTAQALRKALVLPGENPEEIVAEHHHRADFEDISSRDLATLWTAPIILTTAVQFFETLASNEPARLRKLHQLPGSVVFLDEAHAALPTPLWPQNWRWLRELTQDWSCSFVLASGSLARFWENEDVVGDNSIQLPDLTPPALWQSLRSVEEHRIAYETLGTLPSIDILVGHIVSAPGPRLVILNTVQSAAIVAQHMRCRGHDTEHLSTALSPNDREAILKRVEKRLGDDNDDDWTLVATSLVEAGIDLSFRTAFRERFSAASLIQVGGRVNRHGLESTCCVYDFLASVSTGLTSNPAAKISARVLERLFADGKFSGAFDAATLVSCAMSSELRQGRIGALDTALEDAEKTRNYPAVAKLGRVIDSDTCTVVVDPILRQRIAQRGRVTSRELLGGSVQIWSNRIGSFALSPITEYGSRGSDLYWWDHDYDPGFLGYMAGALKLREILLGKTVIY